MNKRRYLPSFLIRVQAGDGSALFPYVPAGASEEKYIPLVAGQRGRRSLDVVTVSSAFPFSFFIRFRRIAALFEYIVFPEPKKCDFADFIERERRARGEASSDRAGYEGDLLSVRNYAQGDPMKYIHWKASAKSKELKTKELTSLSQQPVVIDFEKTGIRNREERISCITYLLLRLFRRNIPAGLRIRGLVFAPGTSASHKIAMIRELALYGEEHAET